MSEWNQKNNQNINNLDRARMLRKEAMLLEEKERVKSRLAHLLSISEDELQPVSGADAPGFGKRESFSGAGRAGSAEKL